MNKIGRKLYYDAEGKVLLDTGEMYGDVRLTSIDEDIQAYPVLQGKSFSVLQLPYGARADEFANMGSMKVINGELIIYPRLTIQADKTQITADGVDTATITADQAEAFSVDGVDYTVNPLLFSSEVKGKYTITAKSTLYGSNSIIIEVI